MDIYDCDKTKYILSTEIKQKPPFSLLKEFRAYISTRAIQKVNADCSPGGGGGGRHATNRHVAKKGVAGLISVCSDTFK